jgi:hypothetical protein
MTPKALSRKELQEVYEENEFLVDHINFLEKELFRSKLVIFGLSLLSAVWFAIAIIN